MADGLAGGATAPSSSDSGFGGATGTVLDHLSVVLAGSRKTPARYELTWPLVPAPSRNRSRAHPDRRYRLGRLRLRGASGVSGDGARCASPISISIHRSARCRCCATSASAPRPRRMARAAAWPCCRGRRLSLAVRESSAGGGRARAQPAPAAAMLRTCSAMSEIRFSSRHAAASWHAGGVRSHGRSRRRTTPGRQRWMDGEAPGVRWRPWRAAVASGLAAAGRLLSAGVR